MSRSLPWLFPGLTNGLLLKQTLVLPAVFSRLLTVAETGFVESYLVGAIAVAASEALKGGEGEASEIGGRHIPGCGGGTGGTKVTVFEIDV